MRPVYVCQVPDEMQREIRGILTRLLLYQCGTEEKAEKYFDMSLVDAVQLGMDSKNVDIDCVADSFKNGSYIDGEVPENIRKDVERLKQTFRLFIMPRNRLTGGNFMSWLMSSGTMEKMIMAYGRCRSRSIWCGIS